MVIELDAAGAGFERIVVSVTSAEHVRSSLGDGQAINPIVTAGS